MRQALGEINPSGSINDIYFTLLALFILEEGFADQEDEWQLIAGKARSYLQQAGVTNAQAIVRKFTLLPRLE